MTRSFVAPAGTTLLVSSRMALPTAPEADRTTATVLSAPAAVVIDCELDLPLARRVIVCAPNEGPIVSIAPAASPDTATCPSTSTSTGAVNALMIRSAGSPPLWATRVGALSHAATLHRIRTEQILARRHMVRLAVGCLV